jgi:hypothetical protein
MIPGLGSNWLFVHQGRSQYVWVHVLSDEPTDWMIYYIHYRKMAIPQYVCVDVSSYQTAD